MGQMTYFTRTSVAVLLVAVVVVFVPVPARATEDGGTSVETVPDTPTEPVATPAPAPRKIYFTPVRRINVKKKIVFPVVGTTKFWSGFGDCRDSCRREHFGIDIITYGWKGLPVVAATDGTVIKVTFDKGIAGCSLRIRGRDRWVTKYVHLNTDIPGTDIPGTTCLAPGIDVGSKVTAGQIIGWIGDSGNAEHGAPNLHFELRTPGGYPVDPYRSLRAARKIEYEWLPGDASVTSAMLIEANQTESAHVAIVVGSQEAAEMTRSETASTVYNAPVFVIDPKNPAAVTDQLERLSIERVVVISDDEGPWIQDILTPFVQMIEVVAFPRENKLNISMPDEGPMVTPEVNPVDQFATIISGSVDRIYRSYKPAYEQFIKEHRSVVYASESRAGTSLGERSRSKPAKTSDLSLLWWNTGEGWIGTASVDEIPHFGFAYVTERRATPWTLSFLGSLSEIPPMPVWQSS